MLEWSLFPLPLKIFLVTTSILTLVLAIILITTFVIPIPVRPAVPLLHKQLPADTSLVVPLTFSDTVNVQKPLLHNLPIQYQVKTLENGKKYYIGTGLMTLSSDLVNYDMDGVPGFVLSYYDLASWTYRETLDIPPMFVSPVRRCFRNHYQTVNFYDVCDEPENPYIQLLNLAITAERDTTQDTWMIKQLYKAPFTIQNPGSVIVPDPQYDFPLTPDDQQLVYITPGYAPTFSGLENVNVFYNLGPYWLAEPQSLDPDLYTLNFDFVDQTKLTKYQWRIWTDDTVYPDILKTARYFYFKSPISEDYLPVINPDTPLVSATNMLTGWRNKGTQWKWKPLGDYTGAFINDFYCLKLVIDEIGGNRLEAVGKETLMSDPDSTTFSYTFVVGNGTYKFINNLLNPGTTYVIAMQWSSHLYNHGRDRAALALGTTEEIVSNTMTNWFNWDQPPTVYIGPDSTESMTYFGEGFCLEDCRHY